MSHQHVSDKCVVLCRPIQRPSTHHLSATCPVFTFTGPRQHLASLLNASLISQIRLILGFTPPQAISGGGHLRFSKIKATERKRAQNPVQGIVCWSHPETNACVRCLGTDISRPAKWKAIRGIGKYLRGGRRSIRADWLGLSPPMARADWPPLWKGRGWFMGRFLITPHPSGHRQGVDRQSSLEFVAYFGRGWRLANGPHGLHFNEVAFIGWRGGSAR